MKRILLLTILVLACCFESFGQECPTIKIIPPSKFSDEKPILFSVSIAGKFDSSKFQYKWTFSDGEVFDGQGTTAISFLPNLETEVTASVEIIGLPEGCKNTVSEQIIIPPKLPKSLCRCNDEYGKVSWLEERHHLDALISELSFVPKAKGYLIFSFEKESERESVFIRQKKILNYLQKRKISSSRVLMTMEKDRAYSTAIWIFYEGIKFPT